MAELYEGAELPQVFSVRELTTYIKRLLESDEVLQDVVVTGEVSNFRRHRSGHLYFTLKDEDAALECVCFRNVAQFIGFEPQDGMQVVAGGRVSVYEKQGRYQLVVLFMRPDGLGALRAAFERLRHKLEEEGLFEPSRKRPLPRFPRCIALVTSPTGAAVRDMVTIISRRYPLVHIIIVPTVVQGEQAADSIVASLRVADSIEEVDLIIVGRGGGSAEDLWPFNEERVARAIYACRKPTISAVGHETDVTIADLVADVRAATPSAAAEIAVPDRRELLRDIASLRRRAQLAAAKALEGFRGALLRVCVAITRLLHERRGRLALVRKSLAAHRPHVEIRRRAERLSAMAGRARQAIAGHIERQHNRIAMARVSLRAYSPSQLIARARRRLEDRTRQVVSAQYRLLSSARVALAAAAARVGPRQVQRSVELREDRLRELRRRSARAMWADIDRRRWRLATASGRLSTLDPKAVLRRGYSITMRQATGEVVTAAAQVARRDRLLILLYRGEVEALADEVREEGTQEESEPGSVAG
ncbi:MAG: exodeoxyribonuclease VII large subunit [Armatimonadetes bacterium]|nr:exodeoxyribonuclease VII large subunit [Armatimonadota bacterium]